MRVIVDLGSHITGSPKILQGEKTPNVGTSLPLNGKFVIPTLEGGQIPLGSTDYVLPVDGGDLASQTYASLLAQYPMFSNVYFNPLLQDIHVDELDLTASYTDANGDVFPTRAQTGRGVGANSGNCPGSTAILPVNTKTTPNRPGILITDVINILPFTNNVGANEFLVFWKIYEFTTSEDIRASYGLHSGVNSPAIRSIKEIDQEPADFSVYLSSSSSCKSWTPVGRLQPLATCSKLSEFRLVFINTGTVKRYLATFGVLF